MHGLLEIVLSLSFCKMAMIKKLPKFNGNSNSLSTAYDILRVSSIKFGLKLFTKLGVKDYQTLSFHISTLTRLKGFSPR